MRKYILNSVFLFVFSAMFFVCKYPDVQLTRYDLGKGKEGDVTVRFSFLIDEPVLGGAASSNVAAGYASRSIMPETFPAPAAYKIQVTGGGSTKTTYISGGASTEGSISLPALTAISVEVWAYSTWTDQTAAPSDTALIMHKSGITFTQTQVESGVLQITLNPLTDGAEILGNISMTFAWPANLDVDSETAGEQGVTKLTANLLDMAGTALPAHPEGTIPAAGFGNAGANKTAALAYNGLEAGSYKLRLTFYKAAAPNDTVIGYFTEVVTVWPGSTANKWIDATGTQQDTRFFTAAEFYDAAASVYGIVVKKGTTELADMPLGGIDANRLVKVDAAGETISFTITYDADTAPISGKSLKSVTVFENEAASGSDITGSFGYSFPSGSNHYVSSGNIPVPVGASSYRIEVCVQAPDRVTTKTYSYTFAAAQLGTNYYLTPNSAVQAATGGSEAAPNVITVLVDIGMTTGENISVASGKHIKLISEAGQTRTLKRASGNQDSLITVNGHLTLENIIVDGGAVWTNGSATPPSPAFGAANNGAGALSSGNATLVNVEGAVAKLTLRNEAILQNNQISNSSGSAHGGAVRLSGGAGMLINGTNAEIRYNQAIHAGGAIATAGTSTLTLSNGKIHNNNVVNYDGGAFQIEGGTQVTMNGGEITQNRARHGGGINMANSSSNNVTMSGGVISSNISTGNGSGVYIGDGTLSMSGGARVDPTNDVYLMENKYITIGGTFTDTPSGPVAKITPPSYYTSTRVLGGTTNLTAANSTRFAISDSNWYIQTDATDIGKIHNAKAASRTVGAHTFFYPNLIKAVGAASGTSATPDVITVVNDITHNNIGTIDTLGKHIRLTVPPNSNKTITIANIGQDIFKISNGSSCTFAGNGTGILTLDGNKSSVTLTSSLIYVQGNGTLRLEDGAIFQNTKKTSGAPIYLSGAFIMSGGKITGMEGPEGGAIHVVEGSFTMSGGEISGNRSNGTESGNGGGGVFVRSSSGSFTMTGGEIKNNTVEKNGGGVFVRDGGTFTMSGSAKIDSNQAADGGGVAVSGSGANFTMSESAVISNNTSSSFGGGIRIAASGTVSMNGGTINDNTGDGGGGIFVNDSGNFNMNDGIISGNSGGAATGGGVRVGGNGVFTMTGGIISANNADYGGGVRVDYFDANNGGKFIKQGGTIYGDNAGSNGNTASTTTNKGHAVMAGNDTASGTNDKYRNTTADTAVRMYYHNSDTTDPSGNVNTAPAWLP